MKLAYEVGRLWYAMWMNQSQIDKIEDFYLRFRPSNPDDWPHYRHDLYRLMFKLGDF